MPIRRGNNILDATLGLYLGMPHGARPPRALIDCLNVRIKQKRVVHDNLGWAPFPNDYSAINLDSKPVTLIDSFEKRDGTIQTIFGNTTDIFEYDSVAETVAYLTPRYETGTIDVTNGDATVMGTGTSWLTEAKAGDFIYVGGTGENDPAETWYEILSITSDTELELTVNYPGATSSGESYTLRQVFQGTVKNPWFTETFYNADDLTSGSTQGDRWYATNGIDAVIAWDGDDDVVYEPALGNVDTCRYLRRHKNRMVYVGPTVSGEDKKFSIRTSDVGKPEDTVNGEATELIVHDGPDELLAAEPIGELLAIYAKSHVVLAQYIGLPLVYAFRAVISEYGPISQRAISVYPDFHDFVAPDRMYRFNGANAEALDDHVWREVLRTITPERTAFFHTHFDEEQGELLHVVPLNTDTDTGENGVPERAYQRHYMEDMGGRAPQPYTLRELPALCFGNHKRDNTLTWNQISENWQDYNYRWNDKFFLKLFPLTLFGDENGNVFILNESTTKNGTTMDSYARFARIPAGSIEFRSVISRIYPYIEEQIGSTATVTITLYGSDTMEGVASQLSAQSFETGIPETRHFVTPRKSTRFAEVQIGFEDQQNYWGVTGYALQTEPGAGR